MLNKDFFIEITKRLYRLTLLFPKKEPLRYKMREIADEILADLIGLSFQTPEKKTGEAWPLVELEVLDSFFEVAKAQDWVSVSDILAIQEEYANLKKEFEKINLEDKEDTREHPNLFRVEPQKLGKELKEIKSEENKNSLIKLQAPSFLPATNLERQDKILAFLKENGRAQVWQIKQILPEVTKRTLRRDFDNLLKKGLVERTGEKNNTFYQISYPAHGRDGASPSGKFDSAASPPK